MVSNIPIENVTPPQDVKADKLLYRISRLLFVIAVSGQWLFAAYIIAFYGGVVVSGAYEKINEQLPHGIMEGDLMGNFMLTVHLALAAVITIGGPLQFFPTIRNRFPKFHRWNGRIYFVVAFLITFAGLYMTYTRGAHGGLPGILGNTLNASLIMLFSVLAWQTAMKKQFKAHKKWALRAFLMVSGVWFFRMGYGIWILITGFTAPGSNADLTGFFDRFLMFGHSLVPLLILELYFFAKKHERNKIKKLTAAFLSLLCLLLAAGVVMVSMIFWLPAL